MPEIDQTFLTQQQELLKEIRDELRFSRQTASAAASGSGGAGSAGSAHPGQTFTQFQSATDKTLLGDWNSLGWSNAYKNLYTSSYTGDIAGAIGFSRAPETMSQMEFQSMTRQALGYRAATAVAGFIAPDYTQFSNELSGSIYRNSQRFIRAGSPLASPFGAGLSLGNAHSLASAVGGLAMNDSRLSAKDYAQIVDVGMRTNQFNDVSSSDDFIKRTKELAEATAALTRSLHMSVGEISQVMGNLRTMGVNGVGKQQALLSHLGAMSGVAGMSANEMLQFTGNFAEGMMGSGVNAAAAMQLAATNAATVRNAAAQGFVSSNAIAQGGGALQVASSISRAQLGFAATMPGFLALRGGNGADTFGAMMSGIGTYGSADSMFSMGLDRAEAMDDMSGASAARLFRNNMTSGLKMIGMDPNSRAGQGVMFQRLQSQFGMDAGAARAWIASNSGAGLQAADATEMAGFRQQEAMRMRDEQDRYFSRNSFSGRMAAGSRYLGKIGRNVVDGVTGSIMGYGEQSIDQQARNLGIYGAATGTAGMSLSARADALAQQRLSGDTSTMELSTHDGDALAAGAGFAASSGLGLAGVAGVSSLAGMGLSGMGWAGAGLAAGVGAFALPMLAGAAVFGAGYLAYNALRGDSTVSVGDLQQRNRITRMVDANRRSNGSRGLSILKDKGLTGDAWEQLRTMGADASDGRDTMSMADVAQRVVSENKGMTLQDVMDARAAVAGTTTTADVFTIGQNKFTASGDAKAAITTLLGEDFQPGWLGGYSHVGGTNLAAQSGLMQKYIKSVSRNNGRAGDVETAELRAMLGENFSQFADNVAKMHKDDPSKLDQAAKGFVDTQNAVEGAMLSADEDAARRFMESQINDPDRHVSKADRELFSNATGSAGRGQLLSTMESGRMRELVDSGVFGDAMKAAVGVASDTDLAKMSAEEVNRKYNLNVGKDDWNTVVKEHGSDGQLRSAVQGQILSSTSAKNEQAAAETEAKLLSRTAQVLTALETKLNSNAPVNASTK